MSQVTAIGPRTYAPVVSEDALKKCHRCAYYVETVLFNLCGHPTSEYKIGTKVDFHTIGHMRSYKGSCGEHAVLFKGSV